MVSYELIEIMNCEDRLLILRLFFIEVLRFYQVFVLNLRLVSVTYRGVQNQ